MLSKKVVWIAALFVEAEHLLDHLEVGDLEWEEKGTYFQARFSWKSLEVTFLVSGMGLDRAELALENHLNEDSAYDYALILGFAGGLVKTSRTGDLVLPSSIQFKEESYRPCPEIYGRFLQSAQARPEESSVLSLLCSAEEVIGNPADKAALHAATGAQAVDMEVAAWAKVLDQFKVPWVAVKAILDSPMDEISDDLLNLSDTFGRVLSSKLIALGVRKPLSLLQGLRLRSRLKTAAETYVRVAANFLETEEDRKQANSPAVGGEEGELTASDPSQQEEERQTSS